MAREKILIIGGGIAGLSAGVYGLLAGYDVSIYEKNAVLGGECTGWDRNGYHIDNCIHWLMGTTADTQLNKIWRTIGALDDNTSILTFDKMYTSQLNGQSITLWKDLERTRKEMTKLSPEDRIEINKLIESCKLAERVQIPYQKPTEQFTAWDGIKMMFTMKPAMRIFRYYQDLSIAEFVAKFKHPLLQRVITDFVTPDGMAQNFAMAYGNFTGGDGGLPAGGSRAFAQRIEKRFKSLGGYVHNNISAEKINVENGHAVSVEFSDGSTATGDYIICACDPDYTFNHLLSPDYMDAIFKDVYTRRAAYPIYGMFHVAFAVDSTEDALGGDIITDCTDVIDACSDMELSKYMSPRLTLKNYNYEPTFAPEGKQILQAFCGFNEAAYEIWEALYQNKTDYTAAKQKLAACIKEKLEIEYPAYADKLTVLDIWTPMTYKRWCNAFKGYNQAFIITKDSMKNPYPNAWLQGLDNVLIANQWLSAPGGLPGAAIQGKYAIQRIEKKHKMDK